MGQERTIEFLGLWICGGNPSSATVVPLLVHCKGLTTLKDKTGKVGPKLSLISGEARRRSPKRFLLLKPWDHLESTTNQSNILLIPSIRVNKQQGTLSQVEIVWQHLTSDSQQSTQGASPTAPPTSRLKGHTVPKRKHSGPWGGAQISRSRHVLSEVGFFIFLGEC